MSGTTPWKAQDNVEPIAADTIGAIANSVLFNTVSGCTATYSGVNMTKTIAAGVIIHTGTVTQVAGNDVTLVSDPSNPRWTYTYLNSSGVAAIVSGSAAVTPAVPDTGANPTNSLDYIQAGLTIAANATYKMNKIITNPVGAPPEVLLTINPTGSASYGAKTQNSAYLVPMQPLSGNVTVTALNWAHNAAAGNYDIGIYSWDGTTMTRVVSKGSTSSPAVGSNRVASSITSTVLYRGVRYYFAWATNDGTSTEAPAAVAVTPNAVATNVGFIKATSFPLPATITSLSDSTAGVQIAGQVSGGITL